MRPNIEVLRSAIGPMLTEAGTVMHATGNTVEVDGMLVPEVVQTYAGKLLVRPEADSLRAAMVGSVPRDVLRFEVTLPAETVVWIDDEITVTAAQYDPALVGMKLRVADVPLDSWQVARFCLAERV